MKSLLRFLVVTALLATSASQAFAQQRINERRAVVPAGFIRIAVPQGAVRVVGWDRDSLAGLADWIEAGSAQDRSTPA